MGKSRPHLSFHFSQSSSLMKVGVEGVLSSSRELIVELTLLTDLLEPRHVLEPRPACLSMRDEAVRGGALAPSEAAGSKRL
jgi:hypothetical protein